MTANRTTKRRLAHGVGGVVAVGALLAALIVPMHPLAGAVQTTTSSDVVTDWNGYASNAITVTAAQGPTVAALSFAMVQGAVYDAVNGIEGGHEPYLGAPPAADPGDSAGAAAATAAYRVLIGLFETQQATLGRFYQQSLAELPAAGKAGGIEVGEQAAAAMFAERAGDGRGGPFTVVEGFDPGEWRRTQAVPAFEPAPWVGNVRPFLGRSAASYRSDGPNALTSEAYAEDFAEVKRLGSRTSTVRTPNQTDAAIYWQDNGMALWNRMARPLVASQGLDIAGAARMFAMMNIAAADGAIACWNDKYYWSFWRPITAIHEAASDGNPATQADPTWVPLFPFTPPFPEHPSGHTCITGAIVQTLQNVFGTDKIAFSAFSNNSRTTRSFDRFSAAIKEVIDARVWAGIHFRTADRQGYVIGRKVAHRLRTQFFQPINLTERQRRSP